MRPTTVLLPLAIAALSGCAGNPKMASAPPVQSSTDLPDEIYSALDARDYARAYPLLQPLADKRHPRALFLLGNYHICGRVVDFSCEKALAFFVRAVELSEAAGDEETAVRSKNEVAWINSACEQPGFQRNTRLALQLALEAAQNADPYNLDTLAAAYAANRDFDKAVETQRAAISSLHAFARREQVESYTFYQFDRRLNDYTQRIPAQFTRETADANCNTLP